MSADAPEQPDLHPRPVLLVLSGPSGVGKDAVLSLLRRQRRRYHVVVTATTRSRRRGERDGASYHFLSPEEFQRWLAHGEFLEHAQVYGHWYGVPRQQIREALRRGQNVILKVDVQGTATLRRIVPQAVFVFLAPPSLQELEHRLRERHTEDDEMLSHRLRTASQEMACLSLFDYVVVNETGRLKETAQRIRAIIAAEECRLPPRSVEL